MPAAALSVAETLENHDELTIFANALRQSSVLDVVRSNGQVTLFVPTDTAMRNEGSAFLLERVLVSPSNTSRLDQLLSYHVVLGKVPELSRLTTPMHLDTLAGDCLHVAPLDVAPTGVAVKIGPEAYKIDSVIADNGIIYLIDRLLWQPYDETECESMTVTGHQ